MRATISAALCLAALGCSQRAGGGAGGGGQGPPSWQVVYEDTLLGGALLSAWGTGKDSIYFVGGPLGNSGYEAVALHFDGSSWRDMQPGGADGYWWVSGTGDEDVWMVGERGRITHFDGAHFVEMDRLTQSTLWGVLALARDDAWAVGGLPGKGAQAENDLVLHWDGKSWSKVPLPKKLNLSLNKIWGTSDDDLYAVGEGATIWHREGGGFVLEDNPAKSNLLTVFGSSASEVLAVGGADVLEKKSGGAWQKLDVKLNSAANGVTFRAPGEAIVVGFGGMKDRLEAGEWTDDFEIEPFDDFHGAWSDGSAYWIVGGDFVSEPSPQTPRLAAIGRYGSDRVPPLTP